MNACAYHLLSLKLDVVKLWFELPKLISVLKIIAEFYNFCESHVFEANSALREFVRSKCGQHT